MSGSRCAASVTLPSVFSEREFPPLSSSPAASGAMPHGMTGIFGESAP